MLYHASMTRFGIRKKLKKMARTLVGGDGGDSEYSPPSRDMASSPKPSPPRAAATDSAPRPPASSVGKAPPEVPVSKTAAPQSSKPSSAPAPSPPTPPEEPGAGTTWVQLKRVKPAEIEEGTIRRVEVFGSRMALARVGDDFFVVQGKCPHGPGQLGDGDLEGHLVTCPVHGLEFDVRDGACVSDPDMVSAPVAVKVKGERVFVMAPA